MCTIELSIGDDLAHRAPRKIAERWPVGRGFERQVIELMSKFNNYTSIRSPVG